MTARSEAPTPAHPLAVTVHDRFGGVLTKGVHAADGPACLNEALNVALGLPWSDDPSGRPDLRSLNDGPWSSDDARTEHMLSVGVGVLWDWPSWSSERLASFASLVAEATSQVIVPMALRIAPNAERAARAARAGAAATRAAARAVESAAAAGAGSTPPAATGSAEREWAASAAAWSAKAAVAASWSSKQNAAAPSEVASDTPLISICRILVEAAETTA